MKTQVLSKHGQSNRKLEKLENEQLENEYFW